MIKLAENVDTLELSGRSHALKQPSSTSSSHINNSSSNNTLKKPKASSDRQMQFRESDTDLVRYALKRAVAFAKYSELERLRTPRPISWKEVSSHRSLIGRGVFSDVYRVESVGDNTKAYALKRLNSVMPANA
jgi:hypothetical protein